MQTRNSSISERVGSEACFSRGTGIQACLQEEITFQTAWKNCRSGLEDDKTNKLDLHEAMVAGRPDEVARISDIMCQAVQQWQREVAVGALSSMVTNSVS